MSKLERRGDECSSKDAKSPQYRISNCERRGEGGSRRDVSLGHCVIFNLERRGDECSFFFSNVFGQK